MNLRNAKLTLSLVLAAMQGVAAAASFSDAEKQAALAEQQTLDWQSQTLAACAGKLSEGGDAVAPFLDYAWRADELRYSMTKELIWPSISDGDKAAANARSKADADKARASLASATPAERANTCDAFMLGLNSPDSHLGKRSPDAAKVLGEAFRSHPELQLAWNARDFTSGCVEQSFNAGARAFDKVLAICECQSDAIYRLASKTELHAWADETSSKHIPAVRALENQPWFDRIAPSLLLCD